MPESDRPIERFSISAGGKHWQRKHSSLLLHTLKELNSESPVHCTVSIPEDGLSYMGAGVVEGEAGGYIEWKVIDEAEFSAYTSDKYNLAIRSAAEDEADLFRLLSLGLPLITLDSALPSTLPEDAVISIEEGEYAGELLRRYCQRLMQDRQLLSRMATNARHAARLINSTTEGHGRFPSLPGIDYKHGALNYDARLDEANRHHLLTKPFYNLRLRKNRFERDGLDEDTRRHFCDFANIAFELALPIETRILDVGCGPGWLSEFFARLGYDVTGIDISPSLIDIANQRLKTLPFEVDHSTPLNCRYFVHDIETTALDEKFDVAICYDSLHHFENEHAVLRNISEMLSENGMLFILEGSRPTEDSEAGRELARVMREFHTLESPFDRNYLLELLGKYGFAVVGDYVTAMGLHDRRSLVDGCIRATGFEVNYLLCKKSDTLKRSDDPNSARAGIFAAEITATDQTAIIASPGSDFALHFSVKNIGDTLWIAGGTVRPGIIRFGFWILDAEGNKVEEIHGKPEFRRTMGPSERQNFVLTHRAPKVAGRYLIKLDLVVQGVCWFEQQGGSSLELLLEVRSDPEN